jgi:hypothetical protein
MLEGLVINRMMWGDFKIIYIYINLYINLNLNKK